MCDTFLLCRPNFFGIDYEINPWMHKKNAVIYDVALTQWEQLYESLSEVAKIELIDPVPNLPDMVFTANAGIVFVDEKIFGLSKFYHKERSMEEAYFQEWFEQKGYSIHKISVAFEGAGDALMLGNHMIVGHGFRSDESAINVISQWEIDCKSVKLVDPRFYHLDTCFCPLGDLDYLIFPGAFSEESLGKIRECRGNEIVVDEDEAIHFACNAIHVDRHVFLPTNSPKTVEKLINYGYTPHEIEMTEFIKSGGACKCLTLKI